MLVIKTVQNGDEMQSIHSIIVDRSPMFALDYIHSAKVVMSLLSTHRLVHSTTTP